MRPVAFATSATWLIRHWQARRKQFDIERKGSPYSITECRVPELILVFGSQPAGDVSHKPGGRLPLLSARSDFHHFLYMLPMTVARSSSGGVVICYVLPVLWMTP